VRALPDDGHSLALQLTNFSASAVAGFFASFFSLPFDFVKTRMQKMAPLPDGTMPYKSSVDCALKACAGLTIDVA
jgi:solute carrier family 25 oxoglutarate transporter 11